MKTEYRYGKKTQQLREHRVWTQEHLAQVAGVSPRTIQRVEADRTQDAETLKAIAAAFDVDVQSLRTTYLIPEARLLRVQLVESFPQFVAAEQRFRHHAHARVKMVPLSPELEEEVDDLLDQVFTDRVYVEPDEPDLWHSYIKSVKEPLQSLFGLGFAFLLLDERRDLLLPDVPGLPPPAQQCIEDWRVRHSLLVARHGCFQASSDEPLHRFHEGCRVAANTLFRMVKEEGAGVCVFRNALYAVVNAGGESAMRWCDTCFPQLPGGARLSFDYIEKPTDISRNHGGIDGPIAGV